MVEIDWDLLKERITKRHDEGRLAGIYTLGRYWSPEDIVDVVQQETPEGIEFMMAEKELVDELIRRM